MNRLTSDDIARVAQEQSIDPAALSAVVAVESGGSGFTSDGRCKILYEGHIMWKRLRLRGMDPSILSEAHPTLCFERWTRKHYLGGVREWDRLNAVIAFGQGRPDWESYKKAAYESCSWGLFQLMGMNYKAAGFENVYAFKHAHEAGEARQLEAALTWMDSCGLLDRLRRGDWERFVRGYNGPGQVERYTAKLISAYESARAAA